jgi:hypothetical protein
MAKNLKGIHSQETNKEILQYSLYALFEWFHLLKSSFLITA